MIAIKAQEWLFSGWAKCLSGVT